MLSRLNTVLAVALALTIGLIALTRGDLTRPNIEVLPDMKYSSAYSAYDVNPHFANGRTLQTPVVGTIARGQMPLHYAPTKEDAIRAGEECANPYATTNTSVLPDAGDNSLDPHQASVGRGADLFRIYCVACHGAAGTGDGPVAKRGFPPPPSLVTGNSRQFKDGQLFHILSFGQANMPSLSAQLSRRDRWDLVNYVRTLQKPTQVAPPAPSPVPSPSTESQHNVPST